METIKKYFLETIILILLILVIIGKCQGPKIIEKPIIIRDTIWVKKDSIIYSQPIIINHIKYKDSIIKEYIPDTTYPKLLKQYNSLLSLFLEKNVYADTLDLKEFGNVITIDTVQQNLLGIRSMDYHIKYPKIKETIIYPDKKNQLYIGGGLQGSPIAPINQFNIGLLLKTKQDKIYNLYTGMNKDGQIIYGAQLYYKLSFKKQ